VAATAAQYRALGHGFVVVEATNQWTGAACEALGATRVFLAGKDSGSMLYVVRLA
jgi:hypothetical protein